MDLPLRNLEQRARSLAPIAFFVLAACVSSEEQAFRARLATGCHTEQECVALQQDAAARSHACESHNEGSPPMDWTDCTRLEQDTQAATSLLDDWKARTQREADAKASAERAAAAEDARVSALGDSCEALAAIEDAAAHAPPPRDAKYRELARTRREAKVAAFSTQLDQMLQSKPDLSADVTATRAWAQGAASAARTVVDQLRCYDGDAAAKRQSQLDAWVSSTTDAIDKEEACRASPRCLADRKLAPQLCEAIQNRRGAADDAAIAKLRAQYKAEAHVAFDASACPSR